MQEPAGLWFRVSSGGQDEALQVPQVEGYSASKGYTVATRYTVHGKSAYHGKQQQFLDQALADAKAGKIRVLVVWHSDRLERREGASLINLLAKFAAAGCRVESVQEPTLGQLDFGGQVMTFITGLMNHEKSAHISQQGRLARAEIEANGAVHGKPPWGYTTEGGKYERKLVPTEDGRKYVPEIFAQVIAGRSLRDVARWLTDQGVLPTFKGKRQEGWYPRTIGGIIRRRTYMGYRTEDARTRDGGKTVHKCEALVDAATWQAANDALDQRFADRGHNVTYRDRPDRAMLASALTCGNPACTAGPDSPMYRVMGGKATARAAYYRCTGRGPDRQGCGNMVLLEAVDAAAQRALVDFMHKKVTVTELVKGNNHEAEIADADYQLKHLASQGLDRKAEQKERERLWSLLDELEAAEPVPDEVRVVETGQTYGELWRDLEPAQRGPWLKAQGVKVTATKSYVQVTEPAGKKLLPCSKVTESVELPEAELAVAA